jgi:hypothetical protein
MRRDAILVTPSERLASGCPSTSQILSSGTDHLGIDFLVAVATRSWFLKEIETEIPVSKVL